jgi:ABC-type antimicrobial peptide transport system permease subunit
MFDFPLLQGNSQTALNDPYSVVLTEKAATRLFGDEAPVGQALLINGEYPMTVTGVMKNLPGNTLFEFEALIPVVFLKVLNQYDENWGSHSLNTYVELHPNTRLDLANESIRDIFKKHTDNRSETEAFLYPLSKRHLYSKFENGIPVGGMIETLRIFGLIAGLILLIACINFTNLSTARSEKRAKEVGVRKVMGGKRMSLIKLFLGESMIVSFIAGAMALILALIALPLFRTLMGKQLGLDLTDIRFWLAGLGFVIFTGVLAGSYPAFYLSSFLPVKVLKGIRGRKQSLVSSRKVLVVVQFTIACALIVSTLVIHRQIRYAENRDSGFDKEQLIYTRFEGDIEKNYELIKYDLLSSGTAISVTRNFSPMTQGWGNTWSVNWTGKDPNARIIFDMYQTDAEWAKTVGATIIEGRDIDVYTYATDSTAMLLNESAVKIMNLEHPIGEIIYNNGIDFHVVGVVKDFILRSPYEPVVPMNICGPASWGFMVMHIKFNNHNRMSDNLARAEQIFKQFNPAYPFEYNFVDEEYARKFQDEKTTGTLATWFAGLTIFISCLGLFALVAYMAETRRKEIGIRKVLGASVSDVIYLLSKEFLILVGISIVVASPIAWWTMEKWLSGYSYRTNIPWWLFIVVGCLSLCIALLTVGFQAFKAATTNPVDAIKRE